MLASLAAIAAHWGGRCRRMDLQSLGSTAFAEAAIGMVRACRLLVTGDEPAFMA